MDIHAPDQPVHSWRDFAIHIAIVTVGILIALGLDGVREHFRERRLVLETREIVHNEMNADGEHMHEELRRVTAFRDELKEVTDNLPGSLRAHPDAVRAQVDAQFNPGYFFFGEFLADGAFHWSARAHVH